MATCEDSTRAVHKSKAARVRRVTGASAPALQTQIAKKLTISALHHLPLRRATLPAGETDRLPCSSPISLPFNWLTRLLASFSVRTRIVVLALIPVAGFLANGLTYTVRRRRRRQRLPNGARARPRWPTPAATSKARSTRCASSSRISASSPSDESGQRISRRSHAPGTEEPRHDRRLDRQDHAESNIAGMRDDLRDAAEEFRQRWCANRRTRLHR